MTVKTVAGVLPTVVIPPAPRADLVAYARDHRDWIEETLASRAAILFRGFTVDSPETFNDVVKAISAEEPLEYRERSSPRSQVIGNIYTSTDYPPEHRIFLHSENSYSSTWPMKLFLTCQIPAASGGETPIADTRKILARIDPAVRERFARTGVMYVRNFGARLGLSWKNVFQTDDRSEVERYCRVAGISFEWRDGDRLRTRHVRPAIATHRRTGEAVWFNHAAFFHVTTLEPMMRELLLASYAPEDLPNNTYYGDGAPIEDVALDQIRAAYDAETVMFPWERGDVLVLDNMLTAHGRSSYTGQRKVLVAMTEPVHDA